MAQEDLLKRFCEESTDSLRSFSDQILALENQNNGSQNYSEMMRLLHSMKGSSRMLGLIPLGDALHATEDILSTLDHNHIHPTSEIVDLLLKTSDTLQDALTSELQGEDISWLDAISTDLRSFQQSLTADPDAFIQSLAPHAPEVFQVLNNHQKQTLFQNYHRFKHLYELSISFHQSSFVKDVEEIHAILKEEGMLISTTGSRSQPEQGYDLRFSFLHQSSTNPDALKARLHEYAVELREIPRPTPQVQLDETNPAPLNIEIPVVTNQIEEKAKPENRLSDIEFDEEFRELQSWFLEEADENLKKLSHEILSLEHNPNDDTINSIFRAFHNLKGSGGSYKFPAISRIAHHLESFVDTLRKDLQKIDSQSIDRMLKGVDVLSSLFNTCKIGKHDEIPVSIIEEDIQLILGVTGSKLPVHGNGTPHAKPTATTDTIGAKQKSPDSVRIAHQKIDYIVNTAVELSIAHHAEDKLIAHLSAHQQSQQKFARDWESLRQDIEQFHNINSAALKFRLNEFSERVNLYAEELQSILHTYENNFSLRSLLSRQLSDEVLEIQLLPLEILFESFQRIVRDLSHSLNKQIQLHIEGADVEVDRRIIEALKDPLVHLIRNAIDHGIESPDQRETSGKEPTGTIYIKAESLGYSFSISIQDDGKGLDQEKIAAIAMKQGLATPQEIGRMTKEEIFEFILRPGFTTRDHVTDISGRGVGMDVVLTNLKKFGGEIFIQSERGKGTTFQLVLPCSLALSKVLLIKIHGGLFSLPTGSVERIIQIRTENISIYQGKRTILFENNYLPIVVLEEFLSLQRDESDMRFGIILRKGDKKICLSVPRVIGEEELMTKPLPLHLRNLKMFSGANILPDGTISLFLNPHSINYSERDDAVHAPQIKQIRRKKLLVVDDSFISRELLKNILLTYGYEVAVASDGDEALSYLRTHKIHAVVSDIEMPSMNGFALTSAMKSDPSLDAIPIIIVSAREDDEHKKRGFEVGANAYIVKGNFSQQNLFTTIERLLLDDQ